MSLAFALGLAACGAASSASMAPSMPSMAAAAPAPAVAGMQSGESSTQAMPEALVIEGAITARVDEVGKATEEIRERVSAAGGRIIEERGQGAATGWNTFIKLRVEPEGLHGLVEWLGENTEIVSKTISAEDVSKELFDQELALENLGKTMARLQALLDHEGLDIEAILKIETELTRIRAQIESIKGSQRFLKDRVAFATLAITLERKDGVNHGPETKFMPGARLAMMHLIDPGARSANRLGYGIVISSPEHRASYELDIFEGVDGDKRAIVATVGGAAYSDHLGGGRRSWLNPYLGLRTGYGRLGGSNFVLAAEAGVELFKNKFMILDLNVRATSFFGKGGPDVALIPAAQASISF